MYKAIITIGIVATLMAGCGSSGDETIAASVSKAQFIKQADQVCAELLTKREAAALAWKKEHPGRVGEEELDEAFREVIVPSVRKQAEALESLTPPAADSAEIARMLDHLTEVNRHLEKEGAKGAHQPVTAKFLAETKKYGLDESCGRLY